MKNKGRVWVSLLVTLVAFAFAWHFLACDIRASRSVEAFTKKPSQAKANELVSLLRKGKVSRLAGSNILFNLTFPKVSLSGDVARLERPYILDFADMTLSQETSCGRDQLSGSGGNYLSTGPEFIHYPTNVTPIRLCFRYTAASDANGTAYDCSYVVELGQLADAR